VGEKCIIIKQTNNKEVNVSVANGLERTKNIKLHISLTFIYKIIAIGLSYLLIPLMVKFLGVEKYGIWVTIFSLVSWSAFFDFGLGNGLRNKLSEAISLGNIKLARIYISTGYVAVSLIAFCTFILFMIVFPFLSIKTKPCI
jgi:O-antigen/teichoic acid export membrane protein